MAISFQTLIEESGLEGTVKIVRHSAGKIDMVERYFEDPEGFEAYHRVQASEVFKGADYLAEFGAMRGTRAMFLGIWQVTGVRGRSDISRKTLTAICRREDSYLLRDNHPTPPENRVPQIVYSLKKLDALQEYSGRLIIDWGRGTRSWVQRKLDKPVLSLRERPKDSTILKPFKGYSAARLSYQELKRLAADYDANHEWRDALSVDGVYVIADRRGGKLYIGSAYGEGGIFGRWMHYAKSGHGGNKQLKGLNPLYLQFSVLKPMPDATRHEVLDAESEWKRSLLTRDFGLNEN